MAQEILTFQVAAMVQEQHHDRIQMKYSRWTVKVIEGKPTEIWEDGMFRIYSAKWPEIIGYLKQRLGHADTVVLKTKLGEWSTKGEKFLKDNIDYKDIAHLHKGK